MIFLASLRFCIEIKNRLKKLFQLLFSTLLCLQLVGGPHALFQVYAWGTMLSTYSKETGVFQAAVDTFSGDKPCHLCCKIAESKKADPEKKQDAPVPSGYAKLCPEFTQFADEALTGPSSKDFLPRLPSGKLVRMQVAAYCPPVPPPKCVA